VVVADVGTGTGDGDAGNADNGPDAGPPAGRRGSSEAPHIPQKRNVGALSSLQFGQITMVLQISFLQFNSCSDAIAVLPFILECKRLVFADDESF
jgi:hypothetical protein